ncbi:MAG: ribonuclease HII [Bacilli bacterium]|nr:ribonuclease HII [Bacilli bacterium]
MCLRVQKELFFCYNFIVVVMKEYENELYSKGINYIAGIDEVGRGPLVGPVVTAAVILPKDFYDERINDSKKLTEKKRELLYDVIMENAISVGIGMSSEKVIDKINILEATKKAMLEAINNLNVKPEYLLIDAVKLDADIPQLSIIKGDAKSESIAAASIIAKVTRDRMMIELDKKHPEYDFKHNKGYGTKKHIDALYKYGPLKEHRKTFEPVSSILSKK